MAKRRRLGVYGENLPTKKSFNVTASDFLIGGMVGKFERKFDKAFLVQTPEEKRKIFGDHVSSGNYGSDAVKAVFDNMVGVNGKMYISSHVGNTAGSIDAVTATKSPLDTANPCLRIDDGYEKEVGYGLSGNRTGYTITNGMRITTAVMTAGTASDLFLILDTVAGMVVGDLIKASITGAAPVTIYKVITSIDEATNKVFFVDAVHATSNADVDDVIEIMGFKIQLYRKDINGVEKKVEEELGKKWLSMESTNTTYYAPTVFEVSKWVIVTDLSSASTLNELLPVDVTTVTYLASGADGTAPTTSAHWSMALNAMDNLPVRFLGNPETTDVLIQKAGETFCKSRWDNPKWIYNIAEDRTKTQLITIGQNYQRSDDVLGAISAQWLKVDDIFNSAVNAPDRHVPNIGHVMGAWIRCIGLLGIHWIPAIVQIPLFGCNGVVGDQFLDDDDRTDIADAGVNLIQERAGKGITIRNFFTPSTTEEFSYANGILMRSFLMVAFVDSLEDSENEPNNFQRIVEKRMALLSFFYRLWDIGSTGSAPTGETFGQAQNADGSSTTPEEHFEVQADIINNPQADINAGERDYDSWFTYPAPTGSIKIGVGFIW